MSLDGRFSQSFNGAFLAMAVWSRSTRACIKALRSGLRLSRCMPGCSVNLYQYQPIQSPALLCRQYSKLSVPSLVVASGAAHSSDASCRSYSLLPAPGNRVSAVAIDAGMDSTGSIDPGTTVNAPSVPFTMVSFFI